MYVPPHFEESRYEQLHALIAQHPLGVLVTHTSGGLDANHLPFECTSITVRYQRGTTSWRTHTAALSCVMTSGIFGLSLDG